MLNPQVFVSGVCSDGKQYSHHCLLYDTHDAEFTKLSIREDYTTVNINGVLKNVPLDDQIPLCDYDLPEWVCQQNLEHLYISNINISNCVIMSKTLTWCVGKHNPFDINAPITEEYNIMNHNVDEEQAINMIKSNSTLREIIVHEPEYIIKYKIIWTGKLRRERIYMCQKDREYFYNSFY